MSLQEKEHAFYKAVKQLHLAHAEYSDACLEANLSSEQIIAKPPILLHYKYVVHNKEGRLQLFKHIREAYRFYTGQDRVKLPWRDAPGAFRNIGMTIERLSPLNPRLQKIDDKKCQINGKLECPVCEFRNDCEESRIKQYPPNKE